MRTFGFQWHLTDRCNMRCAHCYQTSFDGAGERGLDDLRRMADAVFEGLAGREVSINLTGGEPLALPHLFELIDHLAGFRELAEVHLITNGTRTGDATLERIAACEPMGVIKVSLESAVEAVNDAIRGPGAFARVSGGIERLAGTGKPVVAMVTLAGPNAGTIAETVAWARAAGLEGVIFERFVPLGRGREGAMAGAALTAREWAGAALAIARAAGLDLDVDDLLPYRAFWLHLTPGHDEPLRGALCNLGEGSMALMPDGTVFPCRRLPLPVGTVPGDPFPEVLRRLAAWGADAIGPRLRGCLCGACGVEGCAGCRALAFALAGDPLADDPGCLLCE